MATGILEEMTLEEVRAFNPEVVVLGVGSTEPHGPILPYGTDYFQCDGLCRRAVTKANQKGARALMYPTLAIGNNVNFKAFPFACRIRVRTLMLVVLDIIEAVEEDGIRKVVLVNGHGGNTDTLHAVTREHFDRTPPERRAFVCLASGMASPQALAAIVHPSDHGGEDETSRVMYLRPDLVRTEKLQELPFGTPLIEPVSRGRVYYVRPWHLHVPLGGGGETRTASADKGRAVVESSAEDLAEFLVSLNGIPWSPNFPYPTNA
jgi:creatinine amidohydrolase